jgi:hypothetical protein
MDALDEVKQEILKRNITKRRQAELEYNRQMRRAIFSKNKPIPPVKSFRTQTNQNSLCIDDEELKESGDNKVDIKDLKWEDKEKLLRVLFAKMNGLVVSQNYDLAKPEENMKVKEIRSYRGAEYPIGPSAFSGSLADRVDRISNIDYDELENDGYGDEALTQKILEKPEEYIEMPQIEISDAPTDAIPIITMEEDEDIGPPIIMVGDE